MDRLTQVTWISGLVNPQSFLTAICQVIRGRRRPAATRHAGTPHTNLEDRPDLLLLLLLPLDAMVR